MSTVIKVENLSKQYRLGLVGSSTIKDDLSNWWAKFSGKENPLLKIGEANDRTKKATSDYVWALKDINFEVNQGEVLGIIGKNGAGKSTLLKILSKITAPTTGSIKSKGRIASLLEVGTGFHPELTGRENLYLNGAILGMKKKEITRKFDEILDFAEVEKYIDTPVKRYSSGMYVRLAFAIAAHLEPEILILDEVLAVGDGEFQKKCLGKMKEVSSQGRTILFVSHNIPSLQNLCTHGIILKNGTLEFEKSTISESINNYLNSNNQSNDTFSFESSPNRKGNKKLQFIKYEILDENKNLIYTLCSGQKTYFRIYFETLKNISLNIVNVAIAITDNKGGYLADLSNKYLNFSFTNVSNNGYFECYIPKFPFMEGIYYLSVIAHCPTEIYDDIENGIQLKVENGDFFGSGKLPLPQHKSFLFDYQWTLERN